MIYLGIFPFQAVIDAGLLPHIVSILGNVSVLRSYYFINFSETALGH